MKQCPVCCLGQELLPERLIYAKRRQCHCVLRGFHVHWASIQCLCESHGRPDKHIVLILMIGASQLFAPGMFEEYLWRGCDKGHLRFLVQELIGEFARFRNSISEQGLTPRDLSASSPVGDLR